MKTASDQLQRAALGALLWAAVSGLASAQSVEQKAFEAACAACHGAKGEGIAGVAPALAGALAPALAKDDGLRYLKSVVLNGLSGRIVSQGQVFMGAMTPQGHLSNEDLALAANHVLRDLNGSALPTFTAADFAAARNTKVSHKELRDLRAKLLP